MKYILIDLASNVVIYEGKNKETALKLKNDLQNFANLMLVKEK